MNAVKTLTVGVGMLSVAITAYFGYQSWVELKDLPPPKEIASHGSKSDSHEEAKADGHGAPAVDGHGAPAADGHGAQLAAPTGQNISVVSVDEVLGNIRMRNGRLRSLGLKMELELFDDSQRSLLDQRQSGIKNTILEVIREQEYEQLSTLSGKLYFKETLVSQINSFLKKPAVKSIHFSNFYLQ